MDTFSVLTEEVGPDGDAEHAGIDRAWAAELERRAAALDSGEDLGISWEDALANARQTPA